MSKRDWRHNFLGFVFALGFGFFAILALGCSGGGGPLSEEVRSAEGPITGDSLVWAEQIKLLAKDGAANDYFGHSVAVDGDTVVVGARLDDDKGSESGSVYVYRRGKLGWALEGKLVGSDEKLGDQFGQSVAVDGDTVLVGAMGHDALGMGSGAVYVFVRNGGVWTEEAKLLAGDGEAGDQLGVSVALQGDTALLGANMEDEKAADAGAGYVFVRKAGVWTEQAKLLAGDGEAGDRLGISVALSGDTALLGAYFDDDNGNASGSAYVFVRNMGVWVEEGKLKAADGSGNDWFGYSVALSGDTALVGCYLDDDKGTDSGSGYVFGRVGGVWTQDAKLLAGDGAAFDYLGISVALDGDMAVLGAYGDDDQGNGSGSGYVFSRVTGVWAEGAKLMGGDVGGNDGFGKAVDLSGGLVVIGSMLDDDKGLDAGAGYVFGIGGAVGSPCGGLGECAGGFCVDGVCCDGACGGDVVDDCQVCSMGLGATGEGVCTVVAAGVACRGAVGVCDVGEVCDGLSEECPADGFVEDGAVCGEGVCEGGVCVEGVGGMGGAGGSAGGAGGGVGGAGGDGGRGGHRENIGEDGSCGCRVVGGGGGGGVAWFLGLVGMWCVRRRRFFSSLSVY